MQHFSQLNVKISAPRNVHSDWGFCGVSQEAALDTSGSGTNPSKKRQNAG